MKYARILGLLAVAAAAMMAFAASASATTLTSNGSLYTSTIHASSEGGHVTLTNTGSGITISCASTVSSTVQSHSDTTTAVGPISALSFTGCTGGWTVTANVFGSLEVHTDASDPNGTSGNGTLTSTGATVSAFSHVLGITCRYKTENTDIGTLTGSKTTGGTATLDVHASIPWHNGSPFCGTSDSTWVGSYLVETPDNLNVDHPQ